MPYNVVVDKKLILDSAGGIYLRARNNSGAARTTGEVVIWDTSVTYAAYTTTTAQDDAKVMGVVAEYTPSAVEGLVQVQGYFTGENLFVNGTTDIAAGDFLSTFTSAGIAAKATTGKAGSFALALEAYSTNDSAGRIKAILLFPNRQDASATVTYGTAGQMAADGLQASNAAGSTAAVSRVDHAHAFTNDTPALVLGSAAATGTVGSVLASDATIAAFDTTVPGTIGINDSAGVGTVAKAARRDHTHGFMNSAAPADGSSHASANADGSAGTLSRSDHGHKAIVLDDVPFIFGTTDGAASAVRIEYNKDETVDALKIGVNTASRRVIIQDYGDLGTDTTLAAANDPELVLLDATATDWAKFHVDTTGLEIDVITGDVIELLVAGIVEYSFSASLMYMSDGNSLVVGSTAARTVGEASTLQVLGTTEGTDSSAVLGLWSATDALEAKLKFLKSGDATVGNFTIVAANEELGGITWYGDDGVDYNAIAAEINVEVDAAPGAGDMPGRMVFSTTADGAETPTEVMRLTSGQNVSVASDNKVIIGNTTSVDIGDTGPPKLQVLSTSFPKAGVEIGHYAANANPPVVFFGKSRGATVGTNLAVLENDELGQIRFFGNDGTDTLTPGAGISAFVDGTPGANDMPGRIVFSTTADGAATLSEVFRISKDQNLYVANGNGVVVGAAAQYALSNGAGATLTPELEVVGTAPADSAIGLLAASADAVGPYITMSKSRNAALGSFTIVVDADVLGNLVFAGDDGVDYMATAAVIRGEVDGTPGAGDMPGALRFMTTADAAESPTSRMFINSAGAVIIGSTDTSTFTGSGGSLIFDEIGAPAGTATNQAQIYAYDSAAVTVMAQQKSDGTNADL